MSKKNRQRGKDLQYWLATDLGGQNIGIAGKADVRWKTWDIETKERRVMPVFLAKSMAQAEINCAPGQRPLLHLHALNSVHSEDLVVMKYRDFKDIELKVGDSGYQAVWKFKRKRK